MLHLHSEGVVHRGEILQEFTKVYKRLQMFSYVCTDLAARNILLSATFEPKISDFGMSRVLKNEVEQKNTAAVTKSDVGPIRHMAPESLIRREYSTKSDVWSYGKIHLFFFDDVMTRHVFTTRKL
jgi:serine/threonine protein kinase